jgi:hypothetical protein
MAVFNTYDNISFFINRTKPYNQRGRNETEEESNIISQEIKELYNKLNIPYIEVTGDSEGYSEIVNAILNKLNKN